MLRVSANWAIPEHEFRISYARSSGPGGQNVNKVNSKVILTWPVSSSPSLSPAILHRLRQRFGNRINKQGELIISSQLHRDQARNVKDCFDKLRVILASVEFPPKRRIATRRTKSSKLRRLASKKHASTRKQLRRRPSSDD